VAAAAVWTGRLAAIAALPVNASDATMSPVDISAVVLRDLLFSKFMATSWLIGLRPRRIPERYATKLGCTG
jgi:hypothetical protein